jgi:hypothetical protein
MSTRKAGVAAVMTARVNPALAVLTKSCKDACQRRMMNCIDDLGTYHVKSTSQDFVDAVNITVKPGQHVGSHDYAT